MGQKILLADTTFTDNTLPILHDDAILTTGSLLLFDPGHSLGGFAGVPLVNDLTVPNVAWREAAALLGSGSQSSLASIVKVTTPNDGVAMKTERTTKGGVHGICSQTNMTVQNFWRIWAAEAIRAYVFANQGHTFFFSLWETVTRAQLASAAAQSPFHYSAGTANFLFHTQDGQVAAVGASGNNRVSPSGNDETAGQVNTPKIINGRSTGITGTGCDSSRQITLGLGAFDAWGSFNVNKAASRIIYRAYLEDLTVSGRTYAAVDAIDYALFQAAFASGGKFYGDTFTNPSTLP